MRFDIVEVFTRAAKITWKYKVLWIFGIFASCGRRSGGNSNYSGSGNGSGTSGNPFTSEMMRQAQAFFESVARWFQQNTWIIFAFIVFIIILIILQIFFTLIGTAGLARGVVKVENGVEHLVFGELFSESLGYFWRLFGAGLVIWLPVMVIFISLLFVGMIPLMSSAQSGGNAMAGLSAVFFLAFCCCMFPVFIALGLYHVQVKRSVIVDDLGIFGALARGWQIFSQNIVGLLIVGVVIFIASFIIGILIAMPVLLLIFPLMVSFMQGSITSWQPFIAVGIFLICYSPIAWFITGILTTYTESVWTLAYLRITQPKQEAPVIIEANA
jgi:hypothetical protein